MNLQKCKSYFVMHQACYASSFVMHLADWMVCSRCELAIQDIRF